MHKNPMDNYSTEEYERLVEKCRKEDCYNTDGCSAEYDTTDDGDYANDPSAPIVNPTEDKFTNITSTADWFKIAFDKCRNIFIAKLQDYGASWRIMRPASVTDQILIKATRIRYIEENGITKVGDGILPEFVAIVNYGIVALIQCELGYSQYGKDMSFEDAIAIYDKYMEQAYELMLKKNNDYNEAWKLMRINSYTDFILMKLLRVMEIEDNNGVTKVSEPIESNYFDMVNYAIFGIIKFIDPTYSHQIPKIVSQNS